MKLFPSIKRRGNWHLVRSIVILALLFATFAWFHYKASFISNNQGSIERITTSNGLRRILSQQSPSNEEEEEGGKDEDGNSKLCHKVSRFIGDQCEFVKENCPNAMGGYINYMQIRYCGFQKASFLFYPISFLWVLVLFYLLSDTAETFFCPSLTEISRYLKLSPNVAGVTFLALGNGAPDIASIIAGVFSGSTGFGVGEPIGGGMFVVTAVMAAVTLFSEVQIDGGPFLRDTITYSISVAFIFGVYISGQVVLWQSLLCLVIYSLYVSSVVIGRFVYLFISHKKKKRLERQEEETKNNTPFDESSALIMDDQQVSAEWLESPPEFINSSLGVQKININNNPTHHRELRRTESIYQNATFFPKIGLIYQPKETLVQHIPPVLTNVDDDSMLESIPTPTERGNRTLPRLGSVVYADHFVANVNVDEVSEDPSEYNYSGFWGGVRRNKDLFLKWIEWEDKAWYGKIFYLVEWPLILARNLTIPKADPEDWSKFFAVLVPLFMGPFVLFALNKIDMTVGNSPMPLWSLLVIIGLVFSLIIIFTTNRKEPPKYSFVFVFVAFFLSIIWIYITANELVSLLKSIGVMWQISDGILAITVLAWGNSLGDLVADVVISRQGFPDMAIGAVYSGPCLNLLIGLGVSITAHCLTKSPSFPIEHTPTVTMSFIFLLCTMFSAILVLSACRFRSPRAYGVLLLIIYSAYLLLSILIELEVVFSQ